MAWLDELNRILAHNAELISQLVYVWWPSLKESRAQYHQEIWCRLLFYISFFSLLEVLYCWADSNLEIRSLIFRERTPKFLDTHLLYSSDWITATGSDWSLWGDILSPFVKRVEVERGRTWTCPCSIFTWDTVGVEGKHISPLRPYWRHQYKRDC